MSSWRCSEMSDSLFQSIRDTCSWSQDLYSMFSCYCTSQGSKCVYIYCIIKDFSNRFGKYPVLSIYLSLPIYIYIYYYSYIYVWFGYCYLQVELMWSNVLLRKPIMANFIEYVAKIDETNHAFCMGIRACDFAPPGYDKRLHTLELMPFLWVIIRWNWSNRHPIGRIP